jgi:hypothetical protein
LTGIFWYSRRSLFFLADERQAGTMNIAEIRSNLESALENSPYILRQSKQRRLLDGLGPGVLSNLDSAGKGPAEKIMVGRKIAYPREAYINWLVSRIAPAPTKEAV